MCVRECVSARVCVCACACACLGVCVCVCMCVCVCVFSLGWFAAYVGECKGGRSQSGKAQQQHHDKQTYNSNHQEGTTIPRDPEHKTSQGIR